MTVLKVEEITKRFGSETAVENLSLSVDRGEFKSLLGPSGCGKTTTLRSIAGLEDPQEGRIYINEELVFDAERGINVNPEDRDIGMVFQSYGVWPHMTVFQNVSFPLEMRNTQKEERERRVREILETVGLGPHADDLATNLSGGQQQRVAISRALAVEPQIILFDEPLASLDAKLRREMRMEIKQICDEFDATILYVTHSQDEAMFLSDDIAIMNNGRIVEEGDPKSLHENPRELFSMQFMGHTNSFDARVTSLDGKSEARITTPVGSMDVGQVQEGIEEGDEVMVTIRPKFIDLVETDEVVREENNTYVGTVNYIAPTRDFTEYDMEVDGVPLSAKTATPLDVVKGDSIGLYIDPSAVKIWMADRVPGIVQ